MWGYEPLLVEICKFFRTGKPPVTAEETLEIFAFMEAADESKRQGACRHAQDRDVPGEGGTGGAGIEVEPLLVPAGHKFH